MKRNKSAEKTTSMEREENVPKPLKSILKVGSSIRENHNSFATLLAKDE
uniref:Uncharacterized protein n=1 Tax=Rhizophora mucronata TaxID=61149 RepID=A0A2P2PQB8_RHIMU